MAKIVQATETFATEALGYPSVVRAGEIFRDDDVRVLKTPTLFREVTLVEQATAAPGERRNR